jgi:hypothetical protein
MHTRAFLVCLTTLTAAVTAAGPARAQPTGGENIVAAANPSRYLFESGVCQSCTATNVSQNSRPPNLNPAGVNFSDCEQNLRLDFPLVVSGFAGSDTASVQVWAGTVDCTVDTNRTSTGAAHPCWQVAPSYGPVLAPASQTVVLSVYARDVLRYSGPMEATAARPFDPTFNYGPDGEFACHMQPTDAQVVIGIYFIPLGPSSNALGTASQFSLTTDVVGPPPPCSVTLHGGPELVDVMWSGTDPGVARDPDRVGFGLWASPVMGTGCTLASGTSTSFVGAPTSNLCPGAGVSELPSTEQRDGVDDPTVTSLTAPGLQPDVTYAVAVASMDGSGNYGPPSPAACAKTTAAAAPATPATPDKVVAGCGCSSAGRAAGSSTGIALTVAALALAKRRRLARGTDGRRLG